MPLYITDTLVLSGVSLWLFSDVVNRPNLLACLGVSVWARILESGCFGISEHEGRGRWCLIPFRSFPGSYAG